MEINEQSIAAYKEVMTDPAKHGIDIRPLAECFEDSDLATPKHILYKEYIEYINKPLPKVFFYLVMDSLYAIGKAPDGCLGYFLKFKPIGS